MANIQPKYRMYNGVRYFEADHDLWYSVTDVLDVLNARSRGEKEIAKSEGVSFTEINGTRYMNASGLATVVDIVVGTDYDSPRSLWIQGWYEDLDCFTETGQELEYFGQGVGDSIINMIDGTCAMRTEGIRERAREAATELHEVAGSLGDAKTFLDGFSSALTVVGADNVKGTCLYTLGDGLTCAINGVASALCTVEGIADGDDDGK